MNRLTYYDKAKRAYVLINPDVDWLQTLGRLEDFKEMFEPKTFEPKTFGRYLSYLRKSLGFTQEAFARKTNFARPTIANYESDTVRPKKEFLHNIIQHCNVPAEELQSAYRKYACGFEDESLDQLLASEQSAELNSAIGKLVVCERKFAGLTKKELAGQVGCSTQTITKIESGECVLSYGMCNLLSAILHSNRLKSVAEKLIFK